MSLNCTTVAVSVLAASPKAISRYMTKIMEWTNDDALELIEQYRSHTELWNRADPKYKDKLCRFRAWSEIAERFGCSKAEVERKMNVLLTQYRREKHKMLVKLYQGIQPNPSKWYAFKRFDFMEAGGGSSSTRDGGGLASAITTNGHSLNGLTTFDAGSSATASAAGVASAVSHHRRLKSKEMKYFGAMGMHLPMLIASSQTLDSWNNVGQFSPPINDRSQLRVPLPIPFSSSQSEMNVSGTAPRSLFGGSSGSDITASPQKPLDIIETDEKEEINKRIRSTPPNIQNRPSSGDCGSKSGAHAGSSCSAGGGSADAEGGSSPLPTASTHKTHELRHSHSHDHEDLDIKQELVDYFQPPHPPAPPDSHRSYSSTEENRPVGAVESDDFAQDLRVSAAAAAAARGLDFSQFVLPRNLRQSSESIDEKYMPLNMRKLNASSATTSTAGQMLMSSLLSNESTSEETNESGHLKSGSQDASAIYAESLSKDDCDFIGSNVTHKLRSMNRTQRIIAEKLISEVLFYGQFNELERSARIQPK